MRLLLQRLHTRAAPAQLASSERCGLDKGTKQASWQARRTCSSLRCAPPRFDGATCDGMWGAGMSGCDGSSSGSSPGGSCKVHVSALAIRIWRPLDQPSRHPWTAGDAAAELRFSHARLLTESTERARGETSQEESDEPECCTGAPGRRRGDECRSEAAERRRDATAAAPGSRCPRAAKAPSSPGLRRTSFAVVLRLSSAACRQSSASEPVFHLTESSR